MPTFLLVVEFMFCIGENASYSFVTDFLLDILMCGVSHFVLCSLHYTVICKRKPHGTPLVVTLEWNRLKWNYMAT